MKKHANRRVFKISVRSIPIIHAWLNPATIGPSGQTKPGKSQTACDTDQVPGGNKKIMFGQKRILVQNFSLDSSTKYCLHAGERN